MLAQIFSIIAPVFLCAGIGFVWSKKGMPYETNFVTRLVTIIGFPCLIFVALIKADINFETLGTMGVASLATVVVFAVITIPLFRLFKIEQRDFLPSMLFANTGNMGLPLCLFAFGEPGLALGIAYFTINILLVFILSPAIATGRANVIEVLKMPLVWAVPAALVIKYLGQEVPVWLFRTLDLIGGFTIPLMLITLGVSLASLHIKSLPRSIWLSVLRLGMGFAVGWGTAEAFGYEGVARGVLIIECTMPIAVFNYLFAQMYGNKPEEVAGTVLVSTTLSFLTLPGLLWFVI
ncbi:MAG: AEC family transporter [Rhodospirillales bacterium]|nr:AEC family transporter [Rhodospirillales bacterium]